VIYSANQPLKTLRLNGIKEQTVFDSEVFQHRFVEKYFKRVPDATERIAQLPERHIRPTKLFLKQY